MDAKTRKLMVQAIALLLMAVAVLPIYLGLQGSLPALTWAGLILVAVGMGLGLWIG